MASGVIDTAPAAVTREPIVLRASQLERILGIKIDGQEVARILTALGCRESDSSKKGVTTYAAPSWRHDLTREADLIEEVARIHGYDKIPEDAPIPVAPSAQRPFDVAMQRLRTVLATAGLSEAMTPSVVRAELDESLSPWTDLPALQMQTPMLKGARTLRRSLIPSLLEGRARNWASASIEANLYEIAHIYLPNPSKDALPSEQYSLGIVSGSDFFVLKGVLESLCASVGITTRVETRRVERAGMVKGGAAELLLGEAVLGYLGIIDPKLLKKHKLPQSSVAAEISLPILLEQAQLVPQQKAVSMFPSIQRDLNFVVGESVAWQEMENVARAAVGGELAGITYRETYRDAEKDGVDRKRVLMTVELQRHDATLSGDQADALVGKLIGACQKELSAELLQ